ncbi:hypothetical protein [Pedobacter sp. WC2423]|uniref:hypothetical protein n=1 Tax=Pedobacter sp. WC2423 TaxID=3234142 RepID=UPI003467AC79
MYYEINVAHKGKHFFATHPRSITDLTELIEVFGVMDKKFTTKEGYSLSVSYHPEMGYGCGAEAIREAIKKNDRQAVSDIFNRK